MNLAKIAFFSPCLSCCSTLCSEFILLHPDHSWARGGAQKEESPLLRDVHLLFSNVHTNFGLIYCCPPPTPTYDPDLILTSNGSAQECQWQAPPPEQPQAHFAVGPCRRRCQPGCALPAAKPPPPWRGAEPRRVRAGVGRRLRLLPAGGVRAAGEADRQGQVRRGVRRQGAPAEGSDRGKNGAWQDRCLMAKSATHTGCLPPDWPQWWSRRTTRP